MSRNSLLSGLVALGVLLSACAPQTAPRAEGGSGSQPGQAAQSRGPKTLTVAVQRELTGWGAFVGTGSAASTSGGVRSTEKIAQDQLTTEKDLDNYFPQLAREMPSIEKGTWRVNPDGTMDLTWAIHPNIKWHDGTPFTSADLMFSFQLFQDPELPTTASQRNLVESASAPDPHTFVVRWKQPFVNANRGEHGDILPRHLFEDLYRADKQSLANSPLFTSEYVGLGPYRLAKWERGSHIEFSRFDDYYQGRPPLDRIVVRFIGDANAMVAAILAGEVDAVLPVAVDLEAALDVRQRWQGTGHQVRTDITGRMPHLEMQHRIDTARPRNGLTDRTVRQAFYHAIDRPALAEVMSSGLSPVADSWYHPAFPERRELESSIPQFPYDLNRAQQLLTQAGWTKGSDGVLVHQPSGERFEVELWGLSGQGFGLERQLNIIATGWKALGAQVELNIVPPARVTDAEYVTFHPGPLFTNPSGERFYTDRLHSRYMPNAGNRWSGFNRGGYNNLQVDALLDRLTVTIDPRERLPLHRELLQAQMADVALMPLYWEVVPTLMLKGVTGPKHVRNDSTHNIFDWNKE